MIRVYTYIELVLCIASNPCVPSCSLVHHNVFPSTLPSSTQTAHLSTLLKMVNDLNTNNITASSIIQEEPKPKPIEYEGRGTVKCHICLKSFTIKSLLRRHYISHHCYEPDKVQSNLCLIDSENDDTKPEASCIECNRYFGNVHARIKVRGQYEIHFYICKKY